MQELDARTGGTGQRCLRVVGCRMKDAGAPFLGFFFGSFFFKSWDSQQTNKQTSESSDLLTLKVPLKKDNPTYFNTVCLFFSKKRTKPPF